MESASPHFLVLVFLVNLLGEAGLPFPFIMQGLLVLAGYQLAHGRVVVGLALLGVALLGSVVGAIVVYSLSRMLGARALQRYRRWVPLKEEWLAKAELRVRAASPLRIGLARLAPGLLLPVSLMAGMVRVSFRSFMGGVAVSELSWVVVFVALGVAAHYLPYDLEKVVRYYPPVMGAVAAVTLLLSLGRLLWRQRRVSRASRVAE